MKRIRNAESSFHEIDIMYRARSDRHAGDNEPSFCPIRGRACPDNRFRFLMPQQPGHVSKNTLRGMRINESRIACKDRTRKRSTLRFVPHEIFHLRRDKIAGAGTLVQTHGKRGRRRKRRRERKRSSLCKWSRIEARKRNLFVSVPSKFAFAKIIFVSGYIVYYVELKIVCIPYYLYQ